MKERRDLIRCEKKLWQKARMEWKRLHLAEALEKAIANRMDSARRAVARGDRELARALKADMKWAAYLKRRAEREAKRSLKGAAVWHGDVPGTIHESAFHRVFRNLTHLAHRPAGGVRVAGAK